MRNTSAEWFLKKKNNTLYGPVSLAEMAQWAQQCRIVAGNQASMNQQDWIPVEEIPELAMEWLALRQDGKRYGPFPLSAVPELLKHQVLPDDAILTHADSGKTLSMSAALAASAQAEPASSTPQDATTAPHPPPQARPTDEPQPLPAPASRKTTPDTPEPSSPAPTREMTALRAQVAELLQQKEEVEIQAQVQIQSLQEACEEAREALEACVRESQTRLQEVETKLAARESQCTELQDALEQARGRNERLQTHEDQHNAALAELRQQVAFMKKNTAALNAQLGTVRQTAAQRAKLLALAWIFVTASLAALLVMLLARGCQRTTPPAPPLPHEQDAATGNNDTLPPVADQEITRDPPPASPSDGTATQPPLPRIQIAGISVTQQDANTLQVRFDESIFSSLDTLAPEGRQGLDDLARQLPRNLAGWKLVVRGHTDNIPLRNNSRFADNSALALARAEAAAAYLIRRAGFPADAITTQAGETPPFPNDTAENRRRNRTVTITIQRQHN